MPAYSAHNPFIQGCPDHVGCTILAIIMQSKSYILQPVITLPFLSGYLLLLLVFIYDLLLS